MIWLRMSEQKRGAVRVTSGSTGRGVVPQFSDCKELDQILPTFTAVAIGKQTAKEAQNYGMKTYISDEATMESMVAKLQEVFGKRKES